MTYGLKDIIDLDYLVHQDEDLQTQEALNACLLRDRKIYHQIKQDCKSEQALLLSWLEMRKAKIMPRILPGTIYSRLYGWMVLAMLGFGLLTGFFLAGSFLVYHGSQPINVTIFFSLFVGLPLVLSLLALLAVCLRSMGKIQDSSGSVLSIFQSVLGIIFFDFLPGLLKKMNWLSFQKELDHLEYTAWFVRMKTREYQGLFFWPFFILVSIFAACFSSGALGAIFFKVLVSDMAFGWQSTLITSSSAVHKLVSVIALPWSGWMPESLAFPGLDQIEGSRIILKEGISVLATRDLVSWWPFICMGIFVYAVVPRLLFILIGIQAQNLVVKRFDFGRPEFRQLIIRMTSPTLDIEAPENGDESFSKAVVDQEVKDMAQRPVFCGTQALILASERVYPEPVLATVKTGIEQAYGVKIGQTIDLRLNGIDFSDFFARINLEEIDPVIFVYEAWQPPIRGVLHDLVQIRQQLPASTSLWVLLTNDTGQAGLKESGLSLTDQDEQFKIWQAGVRKLNDPMIIVKRFVC
ncbi:MAG: DUF2868 domain-containing protein [Pseudomonadota bacterium]